jgi:prevent-host-death family protein
MTVSIGTVNVYDAKTNFSRLLARVEGGDEIVISRHGRPVARLIAYRPDRTVRRPGVWQGRVRIAADFDDFSASDERDWYGA